MFYHMALRLLLSFSCMVCFVEDSNIVESKAETVTSASSDVPPTINIVAPRTSSVIKGFQVSKTVSSGL